MNGGIFRVLWKLDSYYARMYLKTVLLCAAGCLTLIIIGDLFQKADDFFGLAKEGAGTLFKTMVRYYLLTFAPLLLLRFLFPVVLLLPAVIVLTGAAQQNEYVVLRASGISARRALLPLLLPALALALLHATFRDSYLPRMAVDSERLNNQLRGRSHGRPIQIALADGDGQDSAAIGLLDLDGAGVNFLLERRHRPTYRGHPDARADDHPDDVEQYLARRVLLRPRVEEMEEGDERQYEWIPLEGGRKIDFGYYRREEHPWTGSIPTLMTPAMFERHTLGDLVLRRGDLERLEPGDALIALERHRRNAEPWMAFAVVMLGTCMAMRLALRGRHTSYVQNIMAALLAAGGFYFVSALCVAMAESLGIEGVVPVWLPLAVSAPLALWWWWRLDR